MDSTQPLAFHKARTEGHSASEITRWLYAGAAVLLLILMFWGFQQFYLHGKAQGGRPLTPPIRLLVIVHGIAMTTWVILLVAQSLLVTSRKVRLHMGLGKLGAVLAACIFFLGFKLGIESERLIPPQIKIAPAGSMNGALTPKQFMAVTIISIIVFAIFVTLGIFYRKKPALHRPLMLFATINVVGAATFRIPLFHSLCDSFLGTIFGGGCVLVVFGILFVIAHTLLTRTFDRHLAVILGVYAVIDAGIVAFAPTRAWDSIASFLLRM